MKIWIGRAYKEISPSKEKRETFNNKNIVTKKNFLFIILFYPNIKNHRTNKIVINRINLEINKLFEIDLPKIAPAIHQMEWNKIWPQVKIIQIIKDLWNWFKFKFTSWVWASINMLQVFGLNGWIIKPFLKLNLESELFTSINLREERAKNKINIEDKYFKTSKIILLLITIAPSPKNINKLTKVLPVTNPIKK